MIRNIKTKIIIYIKLDIDFYYGSPYLKQNPFNLYMSIRICIADTKCFNDIWNVLMQLNRVNMKVITVFLCTIQMILRLLLLFAADSYFGFKNIKFSSFSEHCDSFFLFNGIYSRFIHPFLNYICRLFSFQDVNSGSYVYHENTNKS